MASSESAAPASRRELWHWAIQNDLSNALVEDFGCFLAEAELDEPALRLLEGLHAAGHCRDLNTLLGGQNRRLEAQLAASGLPISTIELAAKRYLEACRQGGALDLAPARGRTLQKPSRSALAEERALLALREQRPQEEPLAALADRLWAARAELRLRVTPGPPESRVEPSLHFGEDPPKLVYAVEARPARGRGSWWASRVVFKVQIQLSGWRVAPLAASCDCREPGGCAHALAALDASLRWLHGPGSPERARFAEVLATPDWTRVLRHFDAGLARLGVRGGGAEQRLLSWRLNPGEPLSVPEIVPVLHKPLARGGWSRGSRAPVSDLRLHPGWLSHPSDARVVGALEEIQSSYHLHERQAQKRFAALEQLVGHPRVHLGDAGAPLSVRAGALEIVATLDAKGALELRPALGGDLETSVEILATEAPPPWVFFDSQRGDCVLVRVPAEAAALIAALRNREAVFPPESHPELLRRLGPLEAVVTVRLPPSLEGQEVPAERRPIVRLQPGSGGALRAEIRVRPLEGGPVFAPGEGPARVSASGPGGRRFALREPGLEAASTREALAGLPLGAEALAPPWGCDVAAGDPALDLIAALQPRAEAGALAIEWYEAAQPTHVTRTATSADLRVRVQDRRDWFGLSGSLEVDGERVELALLLDAVRRGGRYVAVGPGRFMALSEELRRRLARAADIAYAGRSGLEVGLAAAPAIEDLADGAKEAELCRTWTKLRAKLGAARALEPEPSPSLAKILRPYQVEGFRWLARLAAWGVGGCLADDMGLGKTLQALAVLESRAELGPALVLAPTSVCFNWSREAGRFTPLLRPILYREVERDQALARLGPGDVLIASYALLVRDVERFQAVGLATLVLDEAQAIKNAATRRARAVRDLKADWRFALTGTPVENHLGELWSLFRILSPGLLGSWEQFRERFANPIERGKDPLRREALARVVRPFVLRRAKAQVAPELPSRTEIALSVRLSPAERRLYDDARLAAAARLGRLAGDGAEEAGRFQVLAEITRLRQLACHPRLVDAESRVASSKLERFLAVVDTLREEGHRALVFSQFVKHLDLVRAALDARGVRYAYLDGGTPAAERDRRVEAFQRGEGELFLISLKAGGTGLHLTAANYVIHLDPWWNPAVEDQATDRAHRIGQDKPVTVYRLVSEGTIEETILSLHDQKRDLVAGILEGADAAARFSTRELLQLLRAGEVPPAADEPDDRVGEEELEAAPAAAPAPFDLAQLVAGAEARLAQEGLAAGTRETYGRELRRFLEAERQRPRGRDIAQKIRGYLADLESGQVAAPKGALAIARAALARLG